jgi:hypothetical protein
MSVMTTPDVWTDQSRALTVEEVLPGLGVNLNRYQHRVPDVAVVVAESRETFFQERPPELAVEVASPRTGRYDRSRKKDVYEHGYTGRARAGRPLSRAGARPVTPSGGRGSRRGAGTSRTARWPGPRARGTRPGS